MTLCFKDAIMLERDTHIASHGYVDSKFDKSIREASHTPEKPDSTKKKMDEVVWPKNAKFAHELEVAFGHIPSESEIPS